MIKKVLKRRNLNNPQIKSYAKAVKRGLSSQHIIQVNNGWAVKKAGSSRLTQVLSTQKKAVAYGRKIARNNKVDLFIHKADGRIKNRETYS